MISLMVNSLSFFIISGYTAATHRDFLAAINHLPSFAAMLWVGLSALASILAISLGLAAFRHIDFSRASALRALGPVSTVAVSLMFFPISLTATNWAGAVIIILSFAAMPLLHKIKRHNYKFINIRRFFL